jgi:poly(3-hydroxybutyrate) depolymerase
MTSKLRLLAAGVFVAAVSAGYGQLLITQQPQSCTNVLGSTATFTVTATGTEPLAYQWQKLSSNWADLSGCTDTNLCLTNVQTSHAGSYRVVITNLEAAVTSQVAQLTVVASPPVISPSTLFQHLGVDVGSNASFTVSALGAALSYQWRLDGYDLVGKTGKTIILTNAQLADEGDYTVVVTNLLGAVTSPPARLWVTPPASAFVKGNFTNALGRLPYFYLLPTNYSAERTYPLWFNFHGSTFDETKILTNSTPGWLGVAQYPSLKTFASYRQQEREPTIVLWPTRRAGDGTWTDAYLRQASAMLDAFIAQFSVDTNRIFVFGHSEGVHAAWDVVAMRPGCFAGVGLAAGWAGSSNVGCIKNLPIWAWCAADDEYNQLGNTRTLVRSLRQAGANLIYTEYNSGAHVGGIGMGHLTPALVDWFLAQRRGQASTSEPILSITGPTSEPVRCTGATTIGLAGSATALGQPVTLVTWTNYANNLRGIATGTNDWSVTGIPLVANKTNVIVVVGTTISWAPAFGGNTTFNDTLTVACYPIRATLARQGPNAILNWSGGGPAYCVQRATDLAAGDWTDLFSNATPPVTLPLDAPIGFFRIVGQ